MDHQLVPQGSMYGLIALAAIVLGGILWARRFKREPDFMLIYAGAIGGMVLGAKLGYVVAESWMYLGQGQVFWLNLLYGKTVLGGLLGGYVGVELGKRLTGRTQATGDLFALLVPLGLIAGRIGCGLHGCCQGVVFKDGSWLGKVGEMLGLERWPASQVELIFNLMMLVVLVALKKASRLQSVWRGQLFHVYLMAYGLFRILHEPLRQTPKISWGEGVSGGLSQSVLDENASSIGLFSGYQVLALAVFLLGFVGYLRRYKQKVVEAV